MMKDRSEAALKALETRRRNAQGADDLGQQDTRHEAALKAWETRRRNAEGADCLGQRDTGREAALKASETERFKGAFVKARAAEFASKEAFREVFEEKGWKVAFFEGKTGSPRTGIIDAIAFRLCRKNCDLLDVRLIQLKGGNAGVTAHEIARLKKATSDVQVQWMIAAFDGETLHIVPDEPEF